MNQRQYRGTRAIHLNYQPKPRRYFWTRYFGLPLYIRPLATRA